MNEMVIGMFITLIRKLCILLHCLKKIKQQSIIYSDDIFVFNCNYSNLKLHNDL